MKIGIAGPILVDAFRPYLDRPRASGAPVPKGLGGQAVNLLARGLLDRGHSVVLFSVDPEVTDEVVLEGPRLRICMGPYRPRARRHAMDLFRREREYLRRAIDRERPPIVHAHWTYEFALGSLASRVPVLVTVRDWAPAVLRHYHNAYRLVRFAMDALTFRRARHLSANSAYIQERIERRWGRRAPILPNPVDDEFLRAEPKEPPSGSPLLLSINSGMSRLKNLPALIRAFRLIRREAPSCRLHLAGEDFQPFGKAHVWAQRNRLDEGIAFLGPLDRAGVARALDAADVMVLPSLEESFGNVLIEAMARRVPVVGGRQSGAVPWVLDGGRAGALCDVRAPESIAAEAVSILRSPSRWRELSQAGWSRVRNAFSVSRVVDLCLEQYQDVLAKEGNAMAASRGEGVSHSIPEGILPALCTPGDARHPQAEKNPLEGGTQSPLEGGARGEAGTAGPCTRVLHVMAELHPSGMEVMLRCSAGAWRKAGVIAEVLATGAEEGPYASELRRAGYAIHHIPFRKDVRFFAAFYALLRRGRYEVVHIHSERAGFYYGLLSRVCGARAVLTVHGHFAFRGFLGLRRAVQRNLLRLLGCAYVAVSPSVQRAEHLFLRNRAEVVPNWYDSAGFALPSPSRRREAREAFGIADGRFVVASVGNCHPVKNHGRLLEALARIAPEVDFVYLHAGGEEAGLPERGLAERLGIAGRVRFLGHTLAVEPILHAADVFVMPSLREGFGVAALEAMGAGTPVVLAESPGLDTFRPFEGVVWAKPDAVSLAAALRHVAQMPLPRREDLGRRLHQLARGRYGMERGVRSYLAVYNRRRAAG